MVRYEYILSGAILAVAGLVALTANSTSIFAWFGGDAGTKYPEFELSISCNNAAEGVPASADKEELKHIDDFISFIENHNGEIVQIRFELHNDGAGSCYRMDDQEEVVPDYSTSDGAIFLSEFDAGKIYHANESQQYISAVIDQHILQVSAHWPREWARTQALILPQVQEIAESASYTFGDRDCTRCFSGAFEVHSLEIPAAQLYTVRTLRQ